MISEIRKSCMQYASYLGDYQSISCNDLANGYCKALDDGDTYVQSEYLSALVLRFWYTIDKMYQKCPGVGLDHEEFYMWLVESINYACKYRAWQDPTKKVNAQQAINKCINTIRLQHYYEFNLNKHKTNYNTVSLDTPYQGSESDREVTMLDTIESDFSDNVTSAASDAELLIQSYIDDQKVIEAIILDNIAFNDVEKHTKDTTVEIDAEGNKTKYTQSYTEFWPYKLVQLLGNLPEDYDKYFSSKYFISKGALEASIGAIRKANNQKLYKYLDACLKSLKLKIATDYNY